MRRTVWALAAVAGLVAAAATGGVLGASDATRQAVAAQRPAANTATVERRTLSAMISQGGILTYRARPDGSPYSVINQAHGTYTELPTPGRVVSQGHVLYRVDDRPVVLLYGSTPFFRTLSTGASGPDVAELNADLVALGYATRAAAEFEVRAFGLATAKAVMKLQAVLGTDPERHARSRARWVVEPTACAGGERVGPARGRRPTRRDGAAGHLDRARGAGRAGRLPADQPCRGRQGEHHPAKQRHHAGCRLIGGSGRHLPVEPGSSGPGSSAAAQQTDSCSSGGSQNSSPTITVEVTPSHPAATGTWDRAPVQVAITTATMRDALVVPVTALLARSGGGYAVEVVGAGTRASNHLVPVSLGLFDDAHGLVQVTGSALAPGQAVVVPGS